MTEREKQEQFYAEFGNNLYRKSNTLVTIPSSSDIFNVVTETVNPTQITSGKIFGDINVTKGFLQSENFITGTSGWRIDAEGNVEFGSGYFRGDITGATGTFTGSITATTGHIGGWTILADTIFASSGAVGLLSTVTAGDDIRIWAGNTSPDLAPFRVYESGAFTATNGTITGALTTGAGSSIATTYLSGTVGLSNTNIAAQGWTNTCVFSATDYRTVAWATGVITTAGGTAYNITGANTGNMSASTSYYIYLDIAVSTTLLQTTTTAATAVGSGKVLVATAYANSDTTSKAQYQVYGGVGGVRLFVDNISANSASTNEFISNSAQIANLIVTDAKIGSLAVSKLTAGTISSQSIVMGITGGSGDVEIRAGIAAGDFANAGGASGFIFGLDDSDSDKTKFYWGSPVAYQKFDGTNFTIRGVTSIERVFTAGENITVSSVPVPVYIGSGETDTILSFSSTPDSRAVGYSAGTEKQAQSFQENISMTVNQIIVSLMKNGNPVDSIQISIQTDNAGVPSGTILTSGTVLGSTLPTPNTAAVTIAMSSTVALSANTKYWIVAERTGSLNTTNYYSIAGKNASSDYANGNALVLENGSWTTNTFYDMRVELDLVTSNDKIYVSDANVAARDSFIGFIESTTTYGNTAPIILIGIVSGFTGLTPNSTYYVQDAIGTIGTSAGSTSVPVGLAISTTEILIDRT